MISKQFRHPQKFPHAAPFSSVPPNPNPQFLVTDLVAIHLLLTFQECHINRIIQ